MIEQTIFAVSTDEHRAVLTGSLFVIEENVFKMISLTDIGLLFVLKN